MFVFYMSCPSPLNNRVKSTLPADVSPFFPCCSLYFPAVPLSPRYSTLELSGTSTLLSTNPPLRASSIICFKLQLAFFPETFIVSDNKAPLRGVGDTEIRTGATFVLLVAPSSRRWGSARSSQGRSGQKLRGYLCCFSPVHHISQGSMWSREWELF